MTSELDRQMASPMGRPTMSEPMSADAMRGRILRLATELTDVRQSMTDLTTRLAAAEAERDAAVARTQTAEAERDRRQLRYPNAVAEGERRATAAIVAWLRNGGGISSNGVVRSATAIAEAIWRGDHLKAPK